MINEYREEAAAFASSLIVSMSLVATGSHLTLQRSVCGIEQLTFDVVEIPGCEGFVKVLEQTFFSSEPIVYVTCVLVGLVTAIAARYLKKA